MTSDTSLRPVSPLRARMIEDMTVRGFNEHTRRDYVRHVRSFAAFISRSPDTATAEDLRLFQPLSAGMSSAARIAATAASPTTHVATAPCLRRGRLLPNEGANGGLWNRSLSDSPLEGGVSCECGRENPQDTD